MSGLRVAVVHDYLTQRGGAERVVLAMLRSFPEAVLHTTLYNPETTYSEFAGRDVRTSVLNRFPSFRRDPRRALPFLASAIASLDVSDADVVLASTSGWAHGIRSDVPVVAYCHTPARWIYQPSDYFRGLPSGLGTAFTAVRPVLKAWDMAVARRVDTYLANSTVVADRIRRAYGVVPEIVPPPTTLSVEGPVDPVEGLEPGFLLTVGRRRGYKNTELACAAVEDHTAERLVVVGEALTRARRFSDRVVSLPPVSDAQLRWLYQNCRGLIAVSFEDFGLTPLEAFSFGRPVVALKAGGYLDSCVDGLTGVFVHDYSPSTIGAGVRRLLATSWDTEAIRLHGKRFHVDRFGADLERILGDAAAGRKVPTLPVPRGPVAPAPVEALDLSTILPRTIGENA